MEKINLNSYKDWLDTFLAPTSVKNRHYYARRYVAWLENQGVHTPWDAATTHVSQFIIHGGKAPSTKKNIRDGLTCLYRWGISTGQTTNDPVKAIPRIRVPAHQPRPTHPDFIDKAFRSCKHFNDVTMIVLALYAGLRCKEIASLHSNDIYDGQIRVQGKGSRVRYVPVHEMLEVLIPHIPAGWVFPSGRNPTGHYLPASISQRLGDLLGPEGPGGHSLRHHFATELYSRTHDLILIQELLGHASIATTRIYTRGDSSRLAPAVRALPRRDAVTEATRRALSNLKKAS